MQIDPSIALAGLFVGFTVGLTGMGGGALMTPILVLFFRIDPLAAVSSDLMASFVMKPVGASVHARRGTVDMRLVKWLVIGSVPSAVVGVLILKSLGDGQQLEDALTRLLGAALVVAATTIVVKASVGRRRGNVDDGSLAAITVKPAQTVAIGVLGGLVVGMTSVGSGSLMIVLLLLLYPTLKASQLVGTDLTQAIPLVGAASIAHLFFGDFQLGLTVSLLIGALPAVYVGARLSSRAPDHIIRPILVVVLGSSGLKLLGAPTAMVFTAATAVAATFVITTLIARSRTPTPEPEATPHEVTPGR